MKTLLLLLFMTSAVPAENRTETQRYTGTATDLKSGTVIYFEEHEAVYEGGEHVRSVITYRDPNRAVIAEKRIVLNGSSAAAFRLEDFRYGTIEGAEPAGGGLKLFEKEKHGSSLNERTLSIPGTVAVDAGLNVLVRQSWERLERGEKVGFNLGVPSQLDYFQFRVVKERNETFRGRKAMVVRFESDHWYIRLFVDPVVVWYDAETRRALNYEGISNIYDRSGKAYLVRVTFDKPGP